VCPQRLTLAEIRLLDCCQRLTSIAEAIAPPACHKGKSRGKELKVSAQCETSAAEIKQIVNELEPRPEYLRNLK
jgi:hypothetical protein